MFTGIIEAMGKIDGLEARGGDWRLDVSSNELDFSDIRTGDSIAVSGVCLTVTAVDNGRFSADVSNETRSCTTLSNIGTGDVVNLEKAMLPTSRLGGHIVSGHVDGLARLTGKSTDGRSIRLNFTVPPELARYIANKGSVCLDGISLTVNEVTGCDFSVNIIPHTAEKTTIKYYQAGREVNLEVDVISRYIERLLTARDEGEEHGITRDFLARSGFADS